LRRHVPLVELAGRIGPDYMVPRKGLSGQFDESFWAMRAAGYSPRAMNSNREDLDTMQGKNAIVTGSTSGIGLGIARALAGRGVNVMLNGFGDSDEIEAIRKSIAADCGVTVPYSGADMSRAAEIEAMVDEARAALGGIDIVVNNVGIQKVAPVEEFPVEIWDSILAINLSSTFHTTRLTIADMKERGWGRIINISSAHGFVASPYKCAYVSAKHGLLGFTKTVALECAEQGVTVNAICPGYVLTPLVEKQIPDTAQARSITEEEVVRDVMLANQPTKRFVSTDEVGALAAFLCTDEAGSITGAALPIDGGWIAQ
jgi:3-hydroxybutyrate dehydrogenase